MGKILLGKKDALRSYFSAESLTALWKKVSGRPQKGEDVFQILERQEKCLYLYQTPAAAICAILSQTVKVEQMIATLKAPEHRNLLGISQSPQHYIWLAKTLLILQSLESNLKKSKDLSGEIRAFLLEKLDTLTVTQMVQMLHILAQETSQAVFTKAQWEVLKVRLKRKCPLLMGPRQTVYLAAVRSAADRTKQQSSSSIGKLQDLPRA